MLVKSGDKFPMTDEVKTPQSGHATPVNLKQAVKLARRYFDDIYVEDKLENVLLEEIELTDGDRVWQVTFGYDTERVLETPNSSLFGKSARIIRDYKTVQVDARTGDLIAIKIRKV